VAINYSLHHRDTEDTEAIPGSIGEKHKRQVLRSRLGMGGPGGIGRVDTTHLHHRGTENAEGSARGLAPSRDVALRRAGACSGRHARWSTDHGTRGRVPSPTMK
jgi:hypothetical protein